MTVERIRIVADEAGTEIDAVLVRPEGEPRGGIVVIHEIWGLQEQTRLIAERLAGEGYVAIAPDVLSNAGVDPVSGAELERLRYEATEEEQLREQPRMREALSAARDPAYTAWAVEALRRAVDALAAEEGVEGRIAATGFCFGGSLAFQLAAADPRIRVTLPFYGRGPDRETLARIRVPILAFYGQDDEPLMEDLPRLVMDARDEDVEFQQVVYPGAQHGFFNDLNPHVYDRAAAEDARARLLAALETAFAEPGPAALD